MLAGVELQSGRCATGQQIVTTLGLACSYHRYGIGQIALTQMVVGPYLSNQAPCSVGRDSDSGCLDKCICKPYTADELSCIAIAAQAGATDQTVPTPSYSAGIMLPLGPTATCIA